MIGPVPPFGHYHLSGSPFIEVVVLGGQIVQACENGAPNMTNLWTAEDGAWVSPSVEPFMDIRLERARRAFPI